jgi:hypothetical protein
VTLAHDTSMRRALNSTHWVIHIGAPKTGSTAIQRCLSDNRLRLLEQGVHYPDVSLRGWGHHDLAFLLGGGYPAWATPQPRPLAALQADLQQAVQARPARCVVLSSENFFIYPQPAALLALLQAAGLRTQDSVSIVCCLRRQDEAHMSWYNQTVKAQAHTNGFEDSLRRYHGLWDYADRLRPWQSVFGTAAVQLQDYGATGQGDICSDFLRRVNVDPAFLEMGSSRVNERINRDVLELQRLVNRLPLAVATKRRHHKQLIALSTAAAPLGIFDDRPFLTPIAAEALMQRYAASNAWVAQTFLGRDALFPTADASGGAGAPRPTPAPRGWTVAKMRYTLRWFIHHRQGTPAPHAPT